MCRYENDVERVRLLNDDVAKTGMTAASHWQPLPNALYASAHSDECV